MNHSTPGLPVHHQLPEFTQTHIHWVSDAIQPSHPLLSPSPPAPNPSQHQSLFQWVNSSHEVAKVLEWSKFWIISEVILSFKATCKPQITRILLQCRRHGFYPWVGRIPWRREQLPTPVFWPGEFHGLYILFWTCIMRVYFSSSIRLHIPAFKH